MTDVAIPDEPEEQPKKTAGERLAEMKKSESIFDQLRGDRIFDLSKPVEVHDEVVISNRWDKRAFKAMLEEIDAFDTGHQMIAESVEAGGPLWMDVFMDFYKVVPTNRDSEILTPSAKLNKIIIETMEEAGAYEKLRSHTTSDEIAAALATLEIRPELEKISEKMEEQRERAKELSEQLQDLIDQMNEGMTPEDYQDILDAIEAASDALEEEVGSEESRQAISTIIQEGVERAEGMGQIDGEAAQMWGLEPGEMQRMDATTRMELARRLNSPHLKAVADLFGPMFRLALSAKTRLTDYMPDETFDVELGNDLSKILPSELILFRHPNPKVRMIPMLKLAESRMLQRKTRGKERLGRGGIVYVEDSSGSMSGNRADWAKALGVTLLNLCRREDRSFHAIPYSGAGQFNHFDFSKETGNRSIDHVLEYAELHYGGGTETQGPLQYALELLEKEFAENGFVNSDIVLTTDGWWASQQDWLDDFRERMDLMQARCWGVLIGMDQAPTAMAEICDHKIVTPKDFSSGQDMVDILARVA